MRIITIEEHAFDPDLARATQAAQAAGGGFLKTLATEEAQRAPDVTGRPAMRPMREVPPLESDMGDGRIAELDAHGIGMQVLSYSSPTQLAPAEAAVGLARAANDRLARAVRAHPDRLAGFATLPWQDPQAAAAELERSVKELGLKGTLLIGRPGTTFLDDECYRPVLATLEALRVPLYVHPGAPLPQVQQPYYGGLGESVTARLSLFGWGWHAEAGVQVIRMILSGTFDRYPGLQVISGHWGEMVPFYLQRMDDAMPRAVTGLSRSITETYRSQVFVTPSGMLNLPQFRFIHEVLGADRIIYSVDYPYLTNDGAQAFLQSIPVSDEDKEKIAHRNVEILLGL